MTPRAPIVHVCDPVVAMLLPDGHERADVLRAADGNLVQAVDRRVALSVLQDVYLGALVRLIKEEEHYELRALH